MKAFMIPLTVASSDARIYVNPGITSSLFAK